MSVICALTAALLVAIQPPLQPKVAPPFPPKDNDNAPPAAPAVGRPGRRAVGTPATVEQMRREQKSLLDELDSRLKQRMVGGAFGEADNVAVAADAERRTRVGLALAKSDAERVEELLGQVASLLDLERYLHVRLQSGILREDAFVSARYERLAAQVRLMEAVGADPGVLRRLRDDQLAAATAATKSLIDRRDSGAMSEYEAAVESVARYGACAAAAAAPADRPAAHARDVAFMRDWEGFFKKRADAGIVRQSAIHAATYWRAEAELRELEAAGKADPARLKALRQELREAAKKSVDSESPRRAGGLFQEGDNLAFHAFRARLLQAELGLAADPAERLAVLKRNLADAAETEGYFVTREKSGLSRRDQSLRAACDRVEAEIQLLTAK